MIIWDNFKLRNSNATITLSAATYNLGGATYDALSIDKPILSPSFVNGTFQDDVVIANNSRLVPTLTNPATWIRFETNRLTLESPTIDFANSSITHMGQAYFHNLTSFNSTFTQVEITGTATINTTSITHANVTEATIETLSITKPITLPTGSKFADTRIQPPSGLYLRPVHGIGDYTQFYLLTSTPSVTYKVTVAYGPGDNTKTFGPFDANTWVIEEDWAVAGDVTLKISEGNNSLPSISLGSISPVLTTESGYLYPISSTILSHGPLAQQSCLLTEIDNMAVLTTYWPKDTQLAGNSNRFTLDDEKIAVYLWAKQNEYIRSYQLGPIEKYNANPIGGQLTGILQLIKNPS